MMITTLKIKNSDNLNVDNKKISVHLVDMIFLTVFLLKILR